MGCFVPTNNIDTSDATATASRILNGYTAYVASGKVTGSYVPPTAKLNIITNVIGMTSPYPIAVMQVQGSSVTLNVVSYPTSETISIDGNRFSINWYMSGNVVRGGTVYLMDGSVNVSTVGNRGQISSTTLSATSYSFYNNNTCMLYWFS